MASTTSTSKFKPCLILLLISCTPFLNTIQKSHAAPNNDDNDNDNDLNATRNKNRTGFNWYDQKTLLPSDPAKCMDSFREAGVCLTDFLTNLGRPSAACCEALTNIDSSCLPALMPLLNPYIGHLLGDLCSFVSSGGGVFPFPVTPSVPSVGAGATPPPSATNGRASATPPPQPSPPLDDDEDEC